MNVQMLIHAKKKVGDAPKGDAGYAERKHKSEERVRQMFEPLAETVDETDGLSLSFGDWRMNLRSSNTEPLVRLNIESRGNADLLPQKLALISKVLQEG